MSQPCPPRQEWLRLTDGELTENRAAELRNHAATCAPCARELEGQRALVSRIAAPAPGVPSPGALAAVMARLDAVEPPQRSKRWRFAFVAWGATGFGVAAVVALALTLPRGVKDPGVFTARGTDVAWPRKIGVEVWAIERPIRRLTPGTALALGTPLVATYNNLDPTPAYLLAFALDGAGEAHWLYPAYADPRSDPVAVRLEPSVVQRAFAESVILEDLQPGPLRFVFVVTREPLRVSSIEGLPPAFRAPDRLRARWPEARVDELLARVEAPATRIP